MFTNMMQVPDSYLRAFRESQGVRFVDFCTTDILKDMIISNYLTTTSTETDIGLIKIGKITIRHKGMLSFLIT